MRSTSAFSIQFMFHFSFVTMVTKETDDGTNTIVRLGIVQTNQESGRGEIKLNWSTGEEPL